MLDFDDDASRREKCFTTISQLPTFVDPKQIPSKRSPFSAIQSHLLVHTVEVILPQETYSNIQTALDSEIERPRYARVLMPPSALLEHDFFNTYIKSGNVILISEGRSGSDTVFTLRDGILRIELGKEIYERTGLTGKPCRSGGRKHGKERFLVELNLRLPSMLHGKKGFDRIAWAFNHVLNQSVAWLFYDLDSDSTQDGENKPITKLYPQWVDCPPLCTRRHQVLTPPLRGDDLSEDLPEAELQEHCGALSEWIAMVQLGSPRVSAADDVDPYLSRYAVPDSNAAQPLDLVSLKWHGLIPSTWTMRLFLALLHHSAAKDRSVVKDEPLSWFALSVSALGKSVVEGRDGLAILVLPGNSGRRCLCWDFVGASVVEA